MAGSFDKWEAPVGELYSREHVEANKALTTDEADVKFQRCAQQFLSHTAGLKLTPGPGTAMARQAWNSVFIGLAEQERRERAWNSVFIGLAEQERRESDP